MDAQVYAFAGVIVAIILALFSYVLTLKGQITAVEVEHQTLVVDHCKKLDRIPEIEHKLDTLAGQTEVYFGMMDRYIASVIHSPIHRDRDELMDRIGELNKEELIHLAALLERLQQEETDNNKKFAGALAQARVASLLWKAERSGE